MIGVADPMKGQIPRGFVVLKAGVERDEAASRRRAGALVRNQIGAIAAPKDVAVVAALPKTRSGKILRKTMWDRRRCRRAGSVHHRRRLRPRRTAAGAAAGIAVTFRSERGEGVHGDSGAELPGVPSRQFSLAAAWNAGRDGLGRGVRGSLRRMVRT